MDCQRLLADALHEHGMPLQGFMAVEAIVLLGEFAAEGFLRDIDDNPNGLFRPPGRQNFGI